MRLMEITNKFVDLRNCRGLGMKAWWDVDTMVLKYNGDLIAEIFDYKDSKNFRLRLHPFMGRSYNRQAYKNRIDSVLRSIQAEDKQKRYPERRYYSFVRGFIKVWDSKVKAEYELLHPLEFVYINSRLVIDYEKLEKIAYSDESAPVVELEVNSNLQDLNSKLTAILQGV